VSNETQNEGDALIDGEQVRGVVDPDTRASGLLSAGRLRRNAVSMAKLALLSVSDKQGLVEFATALVRDLGYTLLSTGGTAKLLFENGLPVTEVGKHTGFPEIMEGRVKTLHPKIHGGLLCRRDKPEHLAQAQQNGIELIDLVVVNLYPFEQTVAKPHVELEEAIENIDIGGPSMLRSAAKNHESVTVVCDPADYAGVLAALTAGEGSAALGELRRELALKVFQRTASYDAAIAKYLESQAVEPDLEALSGLPATLSLSWKKAQNLRYGENPHQRAALYGTFHDHYEQLQGKELSYNNILDITAATYLIGEFERPTVAILKHTNPCGVASADTLLAAWEKAYATDKQAPFGGIIIVNNTLDGELAKVIAEIFTEVIIAPRFSAEALAIFAKKKNLRLMIAKEGMGADALQEIRSVVGGVLVQDRDRTLGNVREFKVVTQRQPTDDEWAAMMFGWKIGKHVKSNSIVYCRGEQTLGVGAGQMARVDSSRIAVWKAGEAKLDLRGSVVASEALFPFADGLIAAAEAGATGAIQPGGSVRDAEVIAAADARGMAMVFTGSRHFKH
jgi:phosphoribosylaminoimidazolecarboxamide formyltransferase/IMP cyclohydrolase